MHQSSNNLFQLSIDNIQDILKSVLKYPTIDLELKYPNFSNDCNKLCAQYIYEYLTSPLKSINKFSVSKVKLKFLLNLSSSYNNFFDYMIDILISENLLQIHGETLLFNETFDVSVQLHLLIKKYPMFRGTLNLLAYCVKNFPLALSEKIPAIGVLYPEGNVAFIDEMISEDTAEYSEISILREITVKFISHISQKLPLKILEVGGGRGIITKELLSSINIKNLIEYHFTDIGKRFVIDMKRHSEKLNLDFLKCRTFDITKNPSEQGFDLKSYDIVIGLDVVHATPQIEVSLKNLKSLINDNGILCLLETTHVGRWQNLIMGLNKGWWHFDDSWRTSTPLVSPKLWGEALSNCGYLRSKIMTLDNKTSDSVLIIASCNDE
jgi:phospholipid N-methyltransferase